METTQVLEREEKTTAFSTAGIVREVKSETKRKFSAENKVRIVLEGFRKEASKTIEIYNIAPHEFLDNISPNDVYAGRKEVILEKRRRKNINSGVQEKV